MGSGKILVSKLRNLKLQYRVKWTGYEEGLNWYPAREFMAQNIIKLDSSRHWTVVALSLEKTI